MGNKCIQSGSLAALLLFLANCADGAYTFDSPLFQPGPGAVLLMEKEAPFYKGIISNIHNFSYTKQPSSSFSRGKIWSYFIADQDGEYEFFAICDGRAIIEIIKLDFKTAKTSSSTLRIRMTKDFRYFVMLRFFRAESCRLRVKFPDGRQSDPIDSNYINRQMDSYSLQDLFLQVRSSSVESQANVSSFELRKAFTAANAGNSYSFCNYVSIPSGIYEIRISCTTHCRIVVTATDKGESILTETIKNSTTKSTLPNWATLLTIEFQYEGTGSWELYQQDLYGNYTVYKATYNTIYSYVICCLYDPLSGIQKLRFMQIEHADDIRKPIINPINSTALSIKVPGKIKLNAKENWALTEKYELWCYEDSNFAFVKNLSLSGALPQTAVLSGLKKYHKYKCQGHYHGIIKGTKRYNIPSSFTTGETSQDLPTAPPSDVRHRSTGDSAVRVEWGSVPKGHINGILSYNVYYRKKSDTTWIMKSRNSLYISFNSLEVGDYKLKVCGKTHAGEGPCGEINFVILVPTKLMDVIVPEVFVTNLRFTDKSLVSHVSAEFDVTTVQACFDKCVECRRGKRSCRCESFNLQHFGASATGKCEINDAAVDNFLYDFVRRKGYQYYAVY